MPAVLCCVSSTRTTGFNTACSRLLRGVPRVPKSTVATEPLLRPCSAVLHCTALHALFHYHQPQLHAHTHSRAIQEKERKKKNMLRKCLVNVGLLAPRPHRQRLLAAAACCRVSTSNTTAAATATAATAAEITEDKTKLKTMADLGGPSLLTTLHWLFVKGYFKTTQQMQVSLDWRFTL